MQLQWSMKFFDFHNYNIVYIYIIQQYLTKNENQSNEYYLKLLHFQNGNRWYKYEGHLESNEYSSIWFYTVIQGTYEGIDVNFRV